MSIRCHLIRLLRGTIRGINWGINWVLALQVDHIAPLSGILCIWTAGACGFHQTLGLSLWLTSLWLPALMVVATGLFLSCHYISKGYTALSRWTEAAYQECQKQGRPPPSP